jgi:hypothetical protein
MLIPNFLFLFDPDLVLHDKFRYNFKKYRKIDS